MTPREKLMKAGWMLVTNKKMGCVRIVRWADPVPQTEGGDTHDVWSQGVALSILRDRNNWKKLQAKAAETTVQG